MAPEFTLEQLEGGKISLSELRGRVVIIDFWATWCGPCRSSLPSLETIYQQYRGRGVTVLLLNQDEKPKAIRKFTGHRFSAPILLDAGSQVAQQYGVNGIPHTVVVDQQGRILYRHEGYGGGMEHNLKLILDQLLTPASATLPSH